MKSTMRVFLSFSLLLAIAAQVQAMQASQFLAGAVEVAGHEYSYRLLPPAKLVEGERYPLVLFLHGAGERGADNLAQLRHFPERMAEAKYRERFPCFVLAPQCPSGEDWAPSTRGMAHSLEVRGVEGGAADVQHDSDSPHLHLAPSTPLR